MIDPLKTIKDMLWSNGHGILSATPRPGERVAVRPARRAAKDVVILCGVDAKVGRVGFGRLGLAGLFGLSVKPGPDVIGHGPQPLIAHALPVGVAMSAPSA